MGADVVLTADTLVELLRQQAARCGEKVAFSFSYHGDGRDGAQVTYRELDSRARAIGAGLQRLGAVEGSRAPAATDPGLAACLEGEVVGCGRPRQPVVIVDADTRLGCGPDEVGEIWAGGRSCRRRLFGVPRKERRQ